eukprot:CAMPEP_0202962660 /NCGR_PEP_ID=MMETSP1396-20130829/6761_1 /ASSEMBLY_ACC=CAM_ASM_000872 /TAXON_ID= /ORGANISM="Pseudokeronopsis sp., Strain Brazil" /LENGTH=182 /DNA_ID=CAMNT_0049683391 /DNA_START=435 /DNA_END=983 /DNA_ORIENTATION=+
MIILVLFFAISCYYVYMRPSMFENLTPYTPPTESKRISTTWEEFLKDCGGEVIVDNSVYARGVFNEKYEANIVSWEGYFAELKPTNTLPFFASDHAMNILVKMDPSESSMYADLVLSISSEFLRENKEMINSLAKGDGLNFEGKFMTLGNEFKMHHLHALKITKNGQFKTLSDIIIRESALP